MPYEQEAKVYQFLQAYGEMLLADIPDEQAFKPICEGGVSPAWIIGHLGFVAERVLAMGGGEPSIDFDANKPLFGGGSTPRGPADREIYPAWDELLAIWRNGHKKVVALLPSLTPELLSAENPNERMRGALPTVGDLFSFILTGHEAMHLGQLSTWRRVQGRPPLF
ncbi:MAG: DinB family protein [Phycisphaeraceae bacterium]